MTLVDTGQDTMTGGRVQRACCRSSTTTLPAHLRRRRRQRRHPRLDQAFTRTAAVATLTAVQPAGRFGELASTERARHGFREKPRGRGGYINGGFFVLDKKIGDYLPGDDCVFELGALDRSPAEGSSTPTATTASGSAWTPPRTANPQQDLGFGQSALEDLVKMYHAPFHKGLARPLSSSPAIPASRARGFPSGCSAGRDRHRLSPEPPTCRAV